MPPTKHSMKITENLRRALDMAHQKEKLHTQAKPVYDLSSPNSDESTIVFDCEAANLRTKASLPVHNSSSSDSKDSVIALDRAKSLHETALRHLQSAQRIQKFREAISKVHGSKPDLTLHQFTKEYQALCSPQKYAIVTLPPGTPPSPSKSPNVPTPLRGRPRIPSSSPEPSLEPTPTPSPSPGPPKQPLDFAFDEKINLVEEYNQTLRELAGILDHFEETKDKVKVYDRNIRKYELKRARSPEEGELKDEEPEGTVTRGRKKRNTGMGMSERLCRTAEGELYCSTAKTLHHRPRVSKGELNALQGWRNKWYGDTDGEKQTEQVKEADGDVNDEYSA